MKSAKDFVKAFCFLITITIALVFLSSAKFDANSFIMLVPSIIGAVWISNFSDSKITRLKAVQRGTPLTLIIAFVASLMLANFDTSTNTIAIDYMPFAFILSWVISSALTPIFNLAD